MRNAFIAILLSAGSGIATVFEPSESEASDFETFGFEITTGSGCVLSGCGVTTLNAGFAEAIDGSLEGDLFAVVELLFLVLVGFGAAAT